MDIWRRALQIMRHPLSHGQRNSGKVGVARTGALGWRIWRSLRSGRKWRGDGGGVEVSACGLGTALASTVTGMKSQVTGT